MDTWTNGEFLVRFPGVRVTGQAVFDNAIFGAATRFDQARFEAEAFFESTEFRGNVRFDGTSFEGPARFNRASFAPPSPGATINFRGATARDIEFREAHFSRGRISFQDANFKIVYFQDAVGKNALVAETQQFPTRGSGELDLRGFSYDRIFVPWRDALNILEPYDVQPYRQMEKAFRVMGNDRDADSVYLKQRWRALRIHLKPPRRYLSAAGELIYGIVARFGVRPWRLAAISIVLVASSVCVFHQPSAVTPAKDSGCIGHTLSKGEALGVSLSYFLPVQVPMAACWVASRETAVAPFGESISFALWASILKRLGWIFVPLGVAALGGLLRRDPPR
jgi:hypothetical protein